MHPYPPPASGSSSDPRTSNALDQFFHGLRDRGSVDILDLAGGSQPNLTFISEQGHRPASDGFAHAVDECFAASGDYFANQDNPQLVEKFCAMTLDHPPSSFGGILVWDSLQFLVPPLLEEVVGQLHRITVPGALLLLYFNADERATSLPSLTYHIAGRRQVYSSPRNRTRPVRFLSNRAIEQLFAGFAATKFFVTRDHLREVIVRR